jgi:RND family efflux transporter MFP subunit
LGLASAVIAGGLLVATIIFRLAPPAAQAEPTQQATVVDVVEAQLESVAMNITLTGTVTAAQQVSFRPEVSGRVVFRNPDLIPGGRVKRGEVLARIDQRDYRDALEQAEAAVARAELELETEQGRGRVARQEWDFLGGAPAGQEQSLALRQPHLRAARANLEAARSARQRARVQLERTVVRAPWDAIVVDAQAEVGQLAGPTSAIATLSGTDHVWVRLALTPEQIPRVRVPGVNDEEGSPARVIQRLGEGAESEWQGQVLRLEGQLDSDTRSARLLVQVNEPYNPPDHGVPLLPGTYVEVDLAGRELEGVVSLPRTALYGGGAVWLVDSASRLDRQSVSVLWGTDSHVFVRGLQPGQRVVTSSLSLPLEGQVVRQRGGGGLAGGSGARGGGHHERS